jgi:hypothetical protein
MLVIPAMLYLPTRLAGYSVDPEISRSTRKLTRTSQVIKKQKKSIIFSNSKTTLFYIILIFLLFNLTKLNFTNSILTFKITIIIKLSDLTS